MTKGDFEKFLNNQCTDAELEEFIRWANTEATGAESKVWAFSHWKRQLEEGMTEDHDRFRAIFDKIQDRITAESPVSDNRTPAKRRFFMKLTRAAAALFLPALAVLMYTLAQIATIKKEAVMLAYLADTLEVIAPIGSRTTVQLSDGSTVHLNYGSKLKYPHVFTGNNREITLSGEGYFEVAHQPERPFVVKTAGLDVRALGTTFNVSAYPDADGIEITLIEGKVVLDCPAPDTRGATNVEMMPGQHAIYNVPTGALASSMGQVEKYVAWKDGKLVFDETTLADAATVLNRMFNVDIVVEDDIKGYPFTVTFEDEPLFQILDLMTIAAPIHYEALMREKMANDAFSKQKIILTRKR